MRMPPRTRCVASNAAGLLAAIALLAPAAPAQAQTTTVWSATLTPVHIATGIPAASPASAPD